MGAETRSSAAGAMISQRVVNFIVVGLFLVFAGLCVRDALSLDYEVGSGWYVFWSSVVAGGTGFAVVSTLKNGKDK
jgi:hypothetical protein